MVDVAPPVVDGLTGETEHQVNADILESCLAKHSDGLVHLDGCMTAVQKSQTLIGEGLGPHADTVDWKSRQQSGIFGGDVIRIALDGDFGIFFHLIYIINRVEDFLQFMFVQLRRGASAQIDGGNVGVGGKTVARSGS